MTEEILEQQTDLIPPEDDNQRQKRRRMIQRTYILATIFVFASTILDILSYFEAREWQTIGDAAGTFIAIFLLAASYIRFRRGDDEAAANLIPFVIFVTYAPDELFLGGTLIYNLASGLLLHLIAFLIFQPRNRMHWVRMGGIFIVSVLIIGNIQVFPKLDNSGDPIGPVITGLATILLLWQVGRNIEIRSFQTRLILLILAVGAVPVLLGASITSLVDRQRNITQTEDLLGAVSDLKIRELDSWINSIYLDLSSLAGNQDFVLDVQSIQRETITTAYRQRLLDDLFTATDNLKRNSRRYYDIMVVDPDGVILRSTNPDNQTRVLESESKLEIGRAQVSIAPLKIDLTAPELVYDFKIYYPVFNADNELIGGIVGLLNPESMLASITDPGQLGETGQAYLVSSSQKVLTPLRNDPEVNPGPIKSVNDSLLEARRRIVLEERESVVQDGFDYSGEAVFGVYTWIPDINGYLVVEQSRFEANAELRVNLLINVIVGLIAFAITLVAAVTTARSLASPILTLSESASEVREGTVRSIKPLDRADEIGDLSVTLSEMTEQLIMTTANLENTVTERTAILERRAKYLETTAQISRAVTAIYDLNSLLNNIVQLIHENFGFYHVGIFILDEQGEYAVLRASNSEGGWKMLARDHKLKVGAQGIVGFVTGSGEPSIQHQVTGEDSVYFDNPDLPLTRSEMALPLKIGEEIFGALDVQSTEEQAFSDEDVAVLQVLADSVSVAIQNSRLVTQLQETLEAERRLYGELSAETWSTTLKGGQTKLNVRSDKRGTGLVSSASSEVGRKALSQQRLIFGELDEERQVYPAAFPVKVRGGVIIGVIETQKEALDGPWTQEEINILETVSSELGLALDNARLFEETQRRSQRDRIAADLSTKIWASSDIENILQTAIQELGSALQVTRGTIRLSLPEDEIAEPVIDGENQS